MLAYLPFNCPNDTKLIMYLLQTRWKQFEPFYFDSALQRCSVDDRFTFASWQLNIRVRSTLGSMLLWKNFNKKRRNSATWLDDGCHNQSVDRNRNGMHDELEQLKYQKRVNEMLLS